MFAGKRIGAILLMGGEGRRFGGQIPKQFLQLADKKVFEHALDTFRASQFFDEIVLVCHPEWMIDGATAGGKTRQESSYLGLLAFKNRPDIVLIHDAVRPFVTEKILRENIGMALEWGAADTCIPSADTLVHAPGGEIIAGIPIREEYLRGQTPQTFRMDWILEAHNRAIQDGIQNASDDCRLVLRLGKPIYIVKGDEKNMKITTEIDLVIAKEWISYCKKMAVP